MDYGTLNFILENIAIVIEFLSFVSLIVFILIFVGFFVGFIQKYIRYIDYVEAEGKERKKGPLIETIVYVVMLIGIIFLLFNGFTRIPNFGNDSPIFIFFILAIVGKFIYDNYNFVNEKNDKSQISFNYDFLIKTLTKWNELFKQVSITVLYLLLILFLLFRYLDSTRKRELILRNLYLDILAENKCYSRTMLWKSSIWKLTLTTSSQS